MLAFQELLNQKVEGVVRDISPNDLMYNTGGRSPYYYCYGEDAVRWIKLAMLAAGTDEPGRILDLPSGHGRVLRTLKAAFPAAQITACDLDRDAVDFCATVLGAAPVYSTEDPKQIPLRGPFDLIWCGSLLTHVDRDRWDGFLDLFSSVLAPGGILVFTTHGPWYFELLARRILTLGLSEEKLESLLATYQRDGFGYQDYPGQHRYGISIATPQWVCARLSRLPGIRVISYTERAWMRQHDIVACIRVDETEELAQRVARIEGAVANPRHAREVARADLAADADTSDLHALVLAMWDELRRTQAAIVAELRDLKASLNQPRSEQPTQADRRSLAARHREYQQIVGRVRDVVRRTIQFGATVAVVNKGDEQLLDLDGRQGWHFPRTPDGTYAGHYPADAKEAIDQIDNVRAAGAGYLLFPATAFWWLDHYPGLREHLERHYRVVIRQDDACLIFALRGSEASPRSVGTGHQHRYLGLVEQVRQVVRSILPSDATVAVVSRGDPTLLDLDAGEAWHYPRLPDGTYAGHYPADSAEAISQVDAVRAAGADYLLFPATAFWWLDHYPGLREHLEQHHRIVVRQQHVCLIYALQDRPTSGPCGNHAAPAR